MPWLSQSGVTPKSPRHHRQFGLDDCINSLRGSIDVSKFLFVSHEVDSSDGSFLRAIFTGTDTR
jgi:hypothetical protein